MSRTENLDENVAALDMDAVQLLVSVSKLKSFKAAAAHHRMTVSNVSSRIRKLESDFGAQVLRRTTRKLELTQLGARLVSLGEVVSQELAAAESELARMAGEFGGTLEFSVSHSILLPFLMPVVLDIAETNTRLRIDVRVANNASPDYGDVRLEFVPRPSTTGHPLVMVICQAIRSVIAPEFGAASQLNELPVCILGHSLTPVPLDIDRETDTTRLEVIPGFMSTDIEILLRAVERGVGVGLLPKIIFDAVASRERFRIMLPELRLVSSDTAVSVSVAPHSRAKAAAVFAANILAERLSAGV